MYHEVSSSPKMEIFSCQKVFVCSSYTWLMDCEDQLELPVWFTGRLSTIVCNYGELVAFPLFEWDLSTFSHFHLCLPSGSVKQFHRKWNVFARGNNSVSTYKSYNQKKFFFSKTNKIMISSITWITEIPFGCFAFHACT